MKRVRKYHNAVLDEDIHKKIDVLSKLNSSVINSGRRILESSSSPLSVIIPIVASSLNPLSLVAQCSVGTTASGGGDLTLIDIDGDGTNDFILDPNADVGDQRLSDLFLGVLNGAEIMARPVGGGFFYATRFLSGASITSGNANWRDAAELPIGGGGAGNQATLDYQQTGDWHGTGLVTGYVAVRIDGNKMGFLEISWNNGNGTPSVNLSKSGVQDDANASNSNLSIGNCDLLPVELITFQVRNSGNSCYLTWVTGAEINNEGFEVQRSENGKEFKTIHWLEGQGNSTEHITYGYNDRNIKANHQYFYRLKQMDFNGSFEYSNVISIRTKGTKSFSARIMSENPVHNKEINLEITSGSNSVSDLTIYDRIGQEVLFKQVDLSDGNTYVNLNIDGLVKGQYIISILQDNEKVFLPVIIQ